MIQSKTEDGYVIEVPDRFHGYHCFNVIGYGSTSIVVLVEDEKTNKKYSAKIMSKKDMESRKLIQSIEKEVSVLKGLDSPFIVKVYDSFNIFNDKNEEFIVIIMDYCEKGDLLTYATENKFKSVLEIKKTVIDFLKGVKFLHERNISHGDIKADNILLTNDLSCKLCDFGYCRTSIIAGEESKNGTLYYAAPELFVKGEFDTLKSDIWAVGVTLYSIFELQFPFKNGNQQFIIRQIRTGNLSIKSSLPDDFKSLLKKCFQLDPQQRASIDEIINDDFFDLDKVPDIKENNLLLQKESQNEAMKDNKNNEIYKSTNSSSSTTISSEAIEFI